ncbi:DUF2238 domain-containing protein [Candidatus Woesearchaeota archaeon]|nr:DUF2238 domain-containing protein [Candidatus Woesearchaeota archaeon]
MNKIDEKKELWILSLMFLAYSVIFFVMSIKNNNYEYIYYNLIMIICFVALLIFYKKMHLKISMVAGLLIMGFLHLAGGNIIVNGLKLYQASLFVIPYDKIVHVFGSFVVTIIAYNLILPILSRKHIEKKIFFIGFFVFIAGVGIGALAEVVEFIATIIVKHNIVGDYANNAADLIANSIGAIIAAIVSSIHFKRKIRDFR